MSYTSIIKRRDSGNNGGHMVRRCISASYTFVGSLASYTFTGIVPVGSTLLGVSGIVDTAITGATSFNVGDGSNADLYGAAVGITKGSTFDQSTSTADVRKEVRTTAGNVVLTAVGGNFTAGKVSTHIWIEENLEKMSF